MLTQAQIELYNPSNAKKLTRDELEYLPLLSNDELKQLAEAYPPNANGIAYLVLSDANAKTQRGQVSTYPALFRLRTAHKQKQFSIATFAVLQVKTTSTGQKSSIIPGNIQDLTDKEVTDAPGLNRGTVKEIVEKTVDLSKDGINGDAGKSVTDGEAAPVLKNFRDVIKSIKSAKSIDAIDALIVGDTRKSVTDAAAAAKAALA